MAIDKDKYKCLYEHQKGLFEEEMLRYRRLEEKVMKYLTSLTLAIGAYLFLIRWVIECVIPPNGVLNWLVVISVLITALAFIFSWSCIFRVIKLSDIIKMESGNEMINLFMENKIEAVHLALSRRYAEGINKLEVKYNDKLKYVEKAYHRITFTGWALITSIIIIVIQQWSI